MTDEMDWDEMRKLRDESSKQLRESRERLVSGVTELLDRFAKEDGRRKIVIEQVNGLSRIEIEDELLVSHARGKSNQRLRLDALESANTVLRTKLAAAEGLLQDGDVDRLREERNKADRDHGDALNERDRLQQRNESLSGELTVMKANTVPFCRFAKAESELGRQRTRIESLQEELDATRAGSNAEVDRLRGEIMKLAQRKSQLVKQLCEALQTIDDIKVLLP